MDAITVFLKKRENVGEIRISIAQVVQWYLSGDPGLIRQQLYDFFKPVADSLTANQYVHDAEHLKYLVDWGIMAKKPFSVQQKFDRLRRRLEDVDLTKACKFPLNSFQVKLIWERLQEEEFQAPSVMFTQFMTELIAEIEKTGDKWPSSDPGWSIPEGEIEYLEEGEGE